jgi:hypothetical protein
MADKYCGQVNIPTVNNDAIACPNYYDTNCVIYQDPIPYFGTVDPSTSTEVFDLLIASLQDARNRIVTLEGASTVNFDLVPTDGSTNAVQSNGIFDALALKLEDAPSNGTQYVRQDGAWAPVAGGATNVVVGDNTGVATTPYAALSSGTENASFGDRAFENAVTLNGSIAIGDMAGFYAAQVTAPTEGVTTELTVATDSIFIGREAKPSANTSINEIVIGAEAFGFGDNTVTIGTLGQTVGTYLMGVLDVQQELIVEGIGTSTFAGAVDVTGNITLTGTVDGRDVATDGTKLDGIEVGATADQIAIEVPITDAGLNFTATEVEGALAELAAAITAGVSDGDKGDITVSGTGAVWTIDPTAVTFAKIQDVTTGVFIGRITSGTGAIEELSGADATTLLSPFSTTTITQGVVPGSNNVGAGYYLEADGTWSIPPTGGVGNTIYSADDALTGARIVDLSANQLTFTDVGGDVNINAGRLGVNTAVFGGSRLGDSFFQTPSIDTQSINIKDNSLNTFLAIFSSAVGAVPGDGVVTSLKNFTDSVNVISISAQDADQTSGTRQVEGTIALRNDYQDNSFTILDMFNQDYPSGVTPLAQEMGWVAIHGGGATAKPIGLYRYDGTTYTNIWKLSPSNVLTYGVDIIVPDETFNVAWNSSLEVPTKNAIYDEIGLVRSEFVDLVNPQAVSGIKTFNDALHAGSGQLIYNDDLTPTGYASGGASGYLGASQYYFYTDHALGFQGYGALSFNSLTADRVYIMPDKAGTVALLSDVSGAVLLNDLTDVTITSPAAGEYLRYNGSNFVNYDPAGEWVPISGGVTLTGALDIGGRVGITTGTNNFTSTSSSIFADASDRIGFKETGVNSNLESMAFDLSLMTAHRIVTWPDKTGTVAFLDDITGSYVTLGTSQTITGAKTFSGGLTMSSNLGADTTSTRDIGSFAIPFFETYSRRFIVKKGTSNKSWRFEGNEAGDSLGINIETTANTDTWTGLYTLNSTGAPANPTDIVDLAYLEANFMELTGNQSAAGIKSFTDSTASTTKDTGAVVITTGGLGVEGAINAGGDITAFASSDPRLKDDMVRIKDPMAKLRLLTGYTFTWNDKQELYFGDDIGLKSTEVAEVIPSAVREGTHGYQQVDYKRVTPLMVEAIKEQQEEINQLRMQNKAMADKMDNIYKTVEFLMKRVTEND